MKLVVIESPYAGNVERNVKYARLCVRDSLMRGESPIASHLLHTQPLILNDQTPEERELGIEAGLAWTRVADLVAVYTNYGMSSGMHLGVDRAIQHGIRVERRVINLLGSKL